MNHIASRPTINISCPIGRFATSIPSVVCFLLLISTVGALNAQVAKDQPTENAKKAQADNQKGDRFAGLRDFPTESLFIQSTQIFHDDVTRLFQELGNPLRALVQQMVGINQKSPVDLNRPLVFYNQQGDFRVQLNAWSPKPKFDLAQFSPDGIHDFVQPAEFELSREDMPMQLFEFFLYDIQGAKKQRFGVMVDKVLFNGRSKKEVASALVSEPLMPKLNSRLQRLYRESGLVLHQPIGNVDEFVPEFRVFDDDDVAPEQQKILETINQIAESTDRAACGLKFKDDCFSFEGVFSLTDPEAGGRVFDFAVAKQRFSHTVGLPDQGLVAAASIHGEVFRSPEFANLLPRIFVPEQNQGLLTDFPFNPERIKFVWGLFSDSWFQIRGSRTGLYVNKSRQFAILSILDARRPDQLLDEFKRIVTLVEPPAKRPSSEMDAEIQKLIKQLASRKFAERNQAYRRLLLAGEKAIPLLQQAVDNPVTAESKRLATRALQQLSGTKIAKETRRLGLSDIEFWNKVEPQFSLAENVSYGTQTVSLLRIHDDPKMSEETKVAVQQQLRALFGNRWNEIPIKRVGDRFVVMFGSDMKLFDAAINNLKSNADPVGELTQVQNQLADGGQIRVYFNTPRLYNNALVEGREWFGGGWKPLPKMIPSNDAMTMLNFKFEPEFWEFAVYWPIDEIRSVVNDLWQIR